MNADLFWVLSFGLDEADIWLSIPTRNLSFEKRRKSVSQ
jgi:hypothetical protein